MKKERQSTSNWMEDVVETHATALNGASRLLSNHVRYVTRITYTDL